MVKSDPSDILIAAESFVGKLPDGSEFAARGGETRIRASHPAVKKWPQFFKPLDLHFDVEQATAAPGEKRQSPVHRAAHKIAKAVKPTKPVKPAKPAKPVEPASAPVGKAMSIQDFEPEQAKS